MRHFLRSAMFSVAVLLAACATHIQPGRTTNPPPLEKFSAFDKFELKPVELAPAYARNGANIKATAKIQEYFDQRVKPTVTGWNGTARGNGPTLLIEPYIQDIKFISIGARIWAGPFAGSSAVVMKVRYRDKSSGKLIAEPEFYQRAAAMSGTMTVGGQDNAMLARIVTLVADYTTRNYQGSVGGETGFTADTDH